jgi:hypothetical protein
MYLSLHTPTTRPPSHTANTVSSRISSIN